MIPTIPQPSPEGSLFRRTLRRRRAIVAFWLLGTVALMVATSVTIRPTYRADSLLRVHSPAPALDNPATPPSEPDESFLQTQVRLLTSRNVLKAAAKNPEVASSPRIRGAKDAVLELRDAVAVAVVPGTRLIEVSARSPSPTQAADLVNAVVDAYIEDQAAWAESLTLSQIQVLENYLVDLKDKAAELAIRWKELVARGDADLQFPPEPRKVGDRDRGIRREAITLTEYRQVRQDLLAVGLELAETEAWIEAARKAKSPDAKLNQADLDVEITRRFKSDPEVVTLAMKMMDLRTKLAEVRKSSNQPEDPAVRAAEKKLDGLTAQYNQLWETRSRTFREAIVTNSPTSREVSEAEAKAQALRNRQVVLQAEFDKLDDVHRMRANDEVEIALVRDERESLRNIRETVNRRLEQLKFSHGGQFLARPVDRAEPPVRPVNDGSRGLILAVIPFGMFLAAFGLFAGVEAWSGGRNRPVPADPAADKPLAGP